MDYIPLKAIVLFSSKVHNAAVRQVSSVCKEIYDDVCWDLLSLPTFQQLCFSLQSGSVKPDVALSCVIDFSPEFESLEKRHLENVMLATGVQLVHAFVRTGIDDHFSGVLAWASSSASVKCKTLWTIIATYDSVKHAEIMFYSFAKFQKPETVILQCFLARDRHYPDRESNVLSWCMSKKFLPSMIQRCLEHIDSTNAEYLVPFMEELQIRGIDLSEIYPLFTLLTNWMWRVDVNSKVFTAVLELCKKNEIYSFARTVLRTYSEQLPNWSDVYFSQCIRTEPMRLEFVRTQPCYKVESLEVIAVFDTFIRGVVNGEKFSTVFVDSHVAQFRRVAPCICATFPEFIIREQEQQLPFQWSQLDQMRAIYQSLLVFDDAMGVERLQIILRDMCPVSCCSPFPALFPFHKLLNTIPSSASISAFIYLISWIRDRLADAERVCAVFSEIISNEIDFDDETIDVMFQSFPQCWVTAAKFLKVKARKIFAEEFIRSVAQIEDAIRFQFRTYVNELLAKYEFFSRRYIDTSPVSANGRILSDGEQRRLLYLCSISKDCQNDVTAHINYWWWKAELVGNVNESCSRSDEGISVTFPWDSDAFSNGSPRNVNTTVSSGLSVSETCSRSLVESAYPTSELIIYAAYTQNIPLFLNCVENMKGTTERICEGISLLLFVNELRNPRHEKSTKKCVKKTSLATTVTNSLPQDSAEKGQNSSLDPPISELNGEPLHFSGDTPLTKSRKTVRFDNIVDALREVLVSRFRNTHNFSVAILDHIRKNSRPYEENIKLYELACEFNEVNPQSFRAALKIGDIRIFSSCADGSALFRNTPERSKLTANENFTILWKYFGEIPRDGPSVEQKKILKIILRDGRIDMIRHIEKRLFITLVRVALRKRELFTNYAAAHNVFHPFSSPAAKTWLKATFQKFTPNFRLNEGIEIDPLLDTIVLPYISSQYLEYVAIARQQKFTPFIMYFNEILRRRTVNLKFPKG